MTISDLLAETGADIDSSMAPGADPLLRQALFDRWISTPALPLRRSLSALHISRVMLDDGTDLLIIESPEPLPFSHDVTLTIRHPHRHHHRHRRTAA
jgi:hypothetical protein